MHSFCGVSGRCFYSTLLGNTGSTRQSGYAHSKPPTQPPITQQGPANRRAGSVHSSPLKPPTQPTITQQMPANRSVLASGSADGTVMMWDVRATARGPSYTLRGHADRVTGLLSSGGSVYSCSEVGFGLLVVDFFFVGGGSRRFEAFFFGVYFFVSNCRAPRLESSEL